MPLYTFQLAYLKGGMTGQPVALARAAELYRAGLSVDSVDGPQTANLAAVLWQTGDREAAIEALARAVAAEPSPILLVNLGHFYQQSGDVDLAVKAYGRALALSPELAGSKFWQADVERTTYWAEILAQAEASLVAEDKDTTRWQSQIALAREDWPGISVQVDPALEETPPDCFDLMAIARARYEMNELEEARNLAQRAIDAHRACGGAYLVRGLVRQTTGDLAAAERDWRAALFLGQQQAAYYLGRLYEKQGDTGAAAQFYVRAVSPSAVPIDVEVVLYDRRATFDLLPPLFRIGTSPEQAKPWLALARLHEAQGDLGAARQVYRALLFEDPYLEAAQERLEALDGGR